MMIWQRAVRARTLLMGWGMVFALAAAQAQPFPAKPVKVVVPFAAGSGTDVLARRVVQEMAVNLPGNWVFDNKPGANGVIAAQAVAQAPADGYTLLVGTISTHSANPFLIKKLPYHPEQQFEPVGLIGFTAPVLLRHAGAPAKSVKELVEMARKAPGSVGIASANTSSRFAAEMLEKAAGVQLNLVRYSSSPQAHSDVASGHVQYLFGDFTASLPHLQSARLEPLAVASPERLKGHLKVPTLAETGYPGVEVQMWIGLMAPKGTPAEVVTTLNKSLVTALQTEDVKSYLIRQGAMTAVVTTPAEFSAYLKTQSEHWGRMARELGVQPE